RTKSSPFLVDPRFDAYVELRASSSVLECRRNHGIHSHLQTSKRELGIHLQAAFFRAGAHLGEDFVSDQRIRSHFRDLLANGTSPPVEAASHRRAAVTESIP